GRRDGGQGLKRLVLMRHAKAERHGLDKADFDRELTERGRRDAALMGRVMHEAGLIPDRALVSSAARTVQTWEGVAESFPEAEAILTRKLYHAEPDGILALVEGEQDAETVLVVAHNPGIHALALRLLKWCAPGAAVQARFERGFPTSSVAAFRLDEA